MPWKNEREEGGRVRRGERQGRREDRRERREKRETCNAGRVAKIGVKMLSSLDPQVDQVTDPEHSKDGPSQREKWVRDSTL
jgi:hypothetical protein